MKHLHNLAGFLSALCLMAILLITSVEKPLPIGRLDTTKKSMPNIKFWKIYRK